MNTESLSDLRLSDFSTHIADTMRIDMGADSLNAVLISATAIGGYTPREGGGFAVQFRIRGAQPFQGTYQLHHPSFGVLPLFMTPRQKLGDDIVFEAVVN